MTIFLEGVSLQNIRTNVQVIQTALNLIWYFQIIIARILDDFQ